MICWLREPQDHRYRARLVKFTRTITHRIQAQTLRLCRAPGGAWDYESRLIRETIGRLPGISRRRAALIHQLGILAQQRGDHAEAESRYRESLSSFEELGDQAGIARSYHQLGSLAQARGRYQDARDTYHLSLTMPGSPGESHPQAPTDPDVNLSIYPARAAQVSGRVRQCPVREQAG